jgi:hypothetical protein
MPVPASVSDCVFPFTHEELHLRGHRHPVWLIKVKLHQKAKSHLHIFSKFLFFNVTCKSYVLEVLVLLRCGAMSLGDLRLTRDILVVSSSVDILALEDDTNIQSQNSDMVSHHRTGTQLNHCENLETHAVVLLLHVSERVCSCVRIC